MAKAKSAHRKNSTGVLQLPLVIEKDEDGYYCVECPVLPGCYTQGKSLDEALKNIQEVIALLAEEDAVRTLLKNYKPRHVSLHTISVTL